MYVNIYTFQYYNVDTVCRFEMCKYRVIYIYSYYISRFIYIFKDVYIYIENIY